MSLPGRFDGGLLRGVGRSQITPTDPRQRADRQKAAERRERMGGEMAEIPGQFMTVVSGVGQGRRGRCERKDGENEKGGVAFHEG